MSNLGSAWVQTPGQFPELRRGGHCRQQCQRRTDQASFPYKTAEQTVSEKVVETARTPDLREKDEWSHVDLNHGPPACEADRGKIRRRPQKS